MPDPTPRPLADAFAHLAPTPAQAQSEEAALRDGMQPPGAPPRPYHNIAHVEAVLGCLFAWTAGEPPRPLLAAALYHDVVYDPAQHDNEAQSAARCHDALTRLGATDDEIARATDLILLTVRHEPRPGDRASSLMADADLFILGSAPDDYDAYVRAVRAEYAHVTGAHWQAGRPAVIERFLRRERIYTGDWPGRDERETQARRNITREIATLKGE